MNTVQKGDAFEEKCYNLIINAINQGEFGFSKEIARVFRKKTYYSKERENNIVFDLAIEIWPLNAKRYSILYLIESKSYSTKKVPVDDVEEFLYKIQQVDGGNAKAVFITDSSYQDGSFTIAKNKRMMLIEVKQDESYSIVLDLSDKVQNQSSRNFEDPLYFETFIKHVLSSKKIEGLKYLSRNDIEHIAKNILLDFDNSMFYEYTYTNLQKLVNYFENKYALVLEYKENLVNESGKKLFACFDNIHNKILIDNSLIESNRNSFVLSHEIGHFVLHRELKMAQEAYNNFQDSEYDIVIDKNIIKNDRNWIEWQANSFAASLLLPKEILLYRLIDFQKSIGINKFGYIYLDDQRDNKLAYKRIINYLSDYFSTSKKSVIYRLEELKIITYATPKNVYQDSFRHLFKGLHEIDFS